MLKQQLSLKLQQKLSPQQIQVIKLLEVPALELEEKVRQELEENPALEEGMDSDLERENQENDLDITGDEPGNENPDELILGDYFNEDDIPDYRLKSNNGSGSDQKEEIPFSVGETFHEVLSNQIGLQEWSDLENTIADYIIGNIDEEGYLRRDLLSILDDLAFQQQIETDEETLLKLLKIIQTFDPPGVGARDLQECLLLQLSRKEPTVDIQIAQKILSDQYEEFVKKHYEKIELRLNITQQELKSALYEITKLTPKPGCAYGNGYENQKDHIIPDFLLEASEGKLSLSLNNQTTPELRVSTTYKEMFHDYTANKANQTKEMKDAVLFVKQKLDAAQGFIDAIKQRQQTLLRVMGAIVDFQKEFFLYNDEKYLRPMILKDISEITGYDISTVSRVSSSKYIQTEYGIFPVKYFFSESMQTDSGEEVSSREIKKILSECIADENKRKPITDDKLAEILQEKGYVIARRTVAKYREQLGIPVARLRKEV